MCCYYIVVCITNPMHNYVCDIFIASWFLVTRDLRVLEKPFYHECNKFKAVGRDISLWCISFFLLRCQQYISLDSLH